MLSVAAGWTQPESVAKLCALNRYFDSVDDTAIDWLGDGAAWAMTTGGALIAASGEAGAADGAAAGVAALVEATADVAAGT